MTSFMEFRRSLNLYSVEQVKDLLEEAEDTEAKVLSDAVDEIKEEQKAKDESEPHGYVTSMEENITVEPLESVSNGELKDVFDGEEEEGPKVKVIKNCIMMSFCALSCSVYTCSDIILSL